LPSQADKALLLIYIRVTINRIPYSLYTHYKVLAKDWNITNNEVRLSNSNAYFINHAIRKQISAMEELIMLFNAETKPITFQDFQQLFVDKPIKPIEYSLNNKEFSRN
jgi:hypothetical protein